MGTKRGKGDTIFPIVSTYSFLVDDRRSEGRPGAKSIIRHAVGVLSLIARKISFETPFVREELSAG